MEGYTSLWGHMEEESPLSIGQLVYPGDYIGRMGSSGRSTANHCHLGLIEGMRSFLFRMKDVRLTEEIMLQLGYFVENTEHENGVLDELYSIFKVPTFITSYIGDPEYFRILGDFHKGYDIVPVNRHKEPGKNFDMHWPRTKTGQVMNKGFDEKGYGHYVLIFYGS